MSDNFDDYFESAMSGGGGGGGTPSFDWDGRSKAGIGRTVVGEIVGLYKGKVTDFDTGEVKKDKNGKEMPELSVTIQTDLRRWENAVNPGKDEDGNELPPSEDTGLRRLYFRYQGLREVGDAVQKAGSNTAAFFKGVGDGSQLWVKRIASDSRMLNFEMKYKKGSGVPAGDFEFSEEKKAEKPAPIDNKAAESQPNPWADAEPAPSNDEEPPF